MIEKLKLKENDFTNEKEYGIFTLNMTGSGPLIGKESSTNENFGSTSQHKRSPNY